ncbi:MAG: elongation factor G [Alphaproteobacteria bacterium]|nr:elongation factor G [Alphaproteobacteria bacterium]
MASPSGPRCVALVGPYLSGKTTLLESILFIGGAITRKGSAGQNNMVGDSSAEARARQMGVELNVAHVEYLGDSFTYLDCPGSVEFVQDTQSAVVGADAAVIVVEADPAKVAVVAPLLHFLEAQGIPRVVFVNKIDKAVGVVGDLVAALQSVSAKPLVLRHFPILEGDRITGYVDLPSERAFRYRSNAASERVDLPTAIREAEHSAHFAMMEKLADFDDDLMEKLLEEKAPERSQVYADLAREFQAGHIVPVIFGAAEREHGVRRLLKLLRHETPTAADVAGRLGATDNDPLAQVLKTFHTPNFGKLSVVRVLRGGFKEGDAVNGERIGGLVRLRGQQTEKAGAVIAGDVVAFGRLERTRTGDTLSTAKGVKALARIAPLPPVYALAVQAVRRDDEVKMSGAFARIVDEDPAVRVEQSAETHETILWGQGEIHLRVVLDRIRNRYKLDLTSQRPRVPYREAIRKGVKQHARYKRQTGGHGQFGDVHVEVKPLPRGKGFAFVDEVVGGAIPRNFIPAVEDGVREYLKRGPLGFPVVDVSVTLVDGSYHSVDSSEMAFKTAGRMAMQEAMPKCEPVLLEPIHAVRIYVPSDSTAKVAALVSGRRGHIHGFDARPGWDRWDVVNVHLPQSEMHDLIVELRSLSQGVGSYEWTFDHLQELQGPLADKVVQSQAQAAQ